MNLRQLPYPKNFWEHNFGFFWYNDREIFEWNQDDFERKAKEFANAGINHVITFSISHFRFSFHKYWGLINDTLAKLVAACHKYGIYVTEHHSAVYMFRSDSPEREELMLKRFSKRNSSPANWPGFIEDTKEDLIINNRNISDMVEIDPTTGKRYISEQFASYILCPNNPDFVKMYLEYLESVYHTGVDGIMTDDVSMEFANYDDREDAPLNCACKHCREKFYSFTGYKLPECGEDWVKWRHNRETPDFIAWMQFRKKSVRDFHVAVKEHYENLGLKLLRPNYSATTIFWTNPGGYCFDLLPKLDWAFIENTFEHIIRYSWTEWIVEHYHRFALSRHRNIPAMAMYYPDREDTLRFCWALSLNSGIKYLGTTHDSSINLNLWEKDLRNFEKKQRHNLETNRKFSKIAFYFSRLTRDFYPEYEERSRKSQVSWLLACELKNIPCDMLLPEELDRLDEYEVLILNETAIMKDCEIESIRDFVTNGGKLVWLGNNAHRRENFSTRNFKEIWGIEKNKDNIQFGNGRIIILKLEDWTAPLRRRVGGNNRWEGNHFKFFNFKPLSQDEKDLNNRIANLLNSILTKGNSLKVENAPEGLLFHPFISKDEKRIVLHWINTCGTLELPEEGYVTHNDPIPFPHVSKDVLISLIKPDNWKHEMIKEAKIFIPGMENISLDFKDSGQTVKFKLPCEQVKFYGMIELKS